MDEMIVKEIEQFIPSDRILTDLAELYSYSYNASFGEYLPELAIQPENAMGFLFLF
ncbi:FAD-binding oxidoreductase [Bacillus sp. AFS088145]|uniref:FAD-binding oxidoreductase n=1 Tax=Bacillus sp. AFS088145 TaxID=2033514 RepID=UPI0015CF45AD|nr:FAD-binding oxidoreductase [Bacillus sp. AFS088145]